jgi:hypothetical protein
MSHKTYEVRVYIDGTKRWYLNGKLHREDGPAVEDVNDYKAWFLNGERHREDGPAIEFVNGSKEWYLNGKRHREDGPAVDFVDGYKEWYLNGERFSQEEFAAKSDPCDGKVVEIDGKKYKLQPMP